MRFLILSSEVIAMRVQDLQIFKSFNKCLGGPIGNHV